jgi:hypothetical protein
MDYKKLLRALLSKAFKLDAGQIDELLAEETDKDGKKTPVTEAELENKILDADKERVKTLTAPKTGQTYQDGYKAAKKEVLTDLETKAKEKFGVETDVTGLELIEAIVNAKAGDKSKMTDDDVRKHPLFVNAEKEKKQALKDLKDDLEGKLTAKDKEFSRSKTITEVQGKAWGIVEGLKPVLPQNATVANTHKANFLKALEGYDYEITNGNIVISKDGTVQTDGHGNNLTFDELTKNTANNYFEFQNNNGGSNGGNNNQQHQGGGNNYPAGVVKPKNITELAKIVDDPAVKTEDKAIVMKVWETENSNH